MKESTERLLAKLEQATSLDIANSDIANSDIANPDAAKPLDDETAELRESWLALRELLAAADAGSQESKVRIQKSGLAFGKLLGLIATVAASLLVAFVVWTILTGETDSNTPTQELAVPNELPRPAAVIAEVAEAPTAGESTGSVDEFAWEDSFDEQLAAASQAIRSVQADWSGGDRRYSVLLDQFEHFDEELSDGSL